MEQYCYKKKKNQPKLQIRYACSVHASNVSWTSRVKPNLIVYDKVRCKNKGPIISYIICGREKGKCGVFIASHSHRAIPISMKLVRNSYSHGNPIGPMGIPNIDSSLGLRRRLLTVSCLLFYSPIRHITLCNCSVILALYLSLIKFIKLKRRIKLNVTLYWYTD